MSANPGLRDTTPSGLGKGGTFYPGRCPGLCHPTPLGLQSQSRLSAEEGEPLGPDISVFPKLDVDWHPPASGRPLREPAAGALPT